MRLRRVNRGTAGAAASTRRSRCGPARVRLRAAGGQRGVVPGLHRVVAELRGVDVIAGVAHQMTAGERVEEARRGQEVGDPAVEPDLDVVAGVVDVVEVARDVGHHPDPHAVAQIAQDTAGVADDAPVARPSPHLHARSARAGRRDQPASAREIRRHPRARGRRADGERTRGRVTGQPGWDDLAGQAGKAAAARELDHAPAIDRVVQRPAHPRVIERALAHVEEEVAGKWRGRRVHVAGVGESKRARLVERQLDGGQAGGDDCVGAAVLHGGHLRRGILGGRDGDRVGEPVRTRLGRPRAKARVAHQPRAACRCERRDPVRPRSRRGAPAHERRRRPRREARRPEVWRACARTRRRAGAGGW